MPKEPATRVAHWHSRSQSSPLFVKGAGTQPAAISAEATHLDLPLWGGMFLSEEPFVKAVPQTPSKNSLQLKGLRAGRTTTVLQLLLSRGNSADLI